MEALVEEAGSQRRAKEVLKKLNDEAYEELKVVFEEANDELARLWDDVQLPPDEAWAALSSDLRKTTMEKHELHVANS
jgi:hypothetical protein